MKQAKQSDSRSTEEFFDSYAEGFNAIYGNRQNLINRLLNRFFRRSMLLRYRLTLQACEPVIGKSILDVGCGPGHYSVELARRGACEVLGIDFAPAMIGLASAKAVDAGVQAICRFEVGDFLGMDESRCYDHVILMGFMDYIPDPDAVVGKALRLCRNSALFSFPVSSGLLALQRRLRYRKRCPLYLYSLSRVERLFSERNGIRFLVRKIGRDYWVRAESAGGQNS